jgi:hypothetical protein
MRLVAGPSCGGVWGRVQSGELGLDPFYFFSRARELSGQPGSEKWVLVGGGRRGAWVGDQVATFLPGGCEFA